MMFLCVLRWHAIFWTILSCFPIGMLYVDCGTCDGQYFPPKEPLDWAREGYMHTLLDDNICSDIKDYSWCYSFSCLAHILSCVVLLCRKTGRAAMTLWCTSCQSYLFLESNDESLLVLCSGNIFQRAKFTSDILCTSVISVKYLLEVEMSQNVMSRRVEIHIQFTYICSWMVK